MLEDLKVLNGVLSPKFDKYNNTYSVDIDSDIKSLELDFKIADGYNVRVVDNYNLQAGNNLVYLEVFNEDTSNVYTLEVYKESVEQVFAYQSIATDATVIEEMPEYIPYAIGGVSFLLIVIVFLLLFKRKN